MTVIEREIPEDRVINLLAILTGDSDREEDFEHIEDLVSSAVFSKFEERREGAKAALARFFQMEVEIYTSSTSDQVSAYLGLKSLQNAFLFVGSYSIRGPELETVPTQRELDILFGRTGSSS